MRRLFVTVTAIAVLLVGMAPARAATSSSGGSCGEDPVMTTHTVTFHFKGHSRHGHLKKVSITNQCSRYIVVEWGRRGSYPDGRGAVNIAVEPHTTATIKSAWLDRHDLERARWTGGGCCYSDISKLTRDIDYVLRANGKLVRYRSPSGS